jgi:hypothetical protein
VLVSLIVSLRSVSFKIIYPAAEYIGYSGHDLGLGFPEFAFYARQVGMVDLGGLGESAQAVAAMFAPPSDFASIGLHISNDT